MSNDIQEAVRLEVERLHGFFVGWFNGTIPKTAFEADFLDRMSKDLAYILPGGNRLGLDELAPAIREGYGSNPKFRIAIGDVQVRWVFDGHVLATYVEWQRNAMASKPPDNGRISTVLFKGPEPLKWLHIHETWLPAEKMSAGPYDF